MGPYSAACPQYLFQPEYLPWGRPMQKSVPIVYNGLGES